MKDPQHLCVVRKGVRHEAGDAHLTRPGRQRFEHRGSQAVALPKVGHDECDLRLIAVIDPVEAGDADDGAVDPCDDRLAVAMVDVGEPVDLGGAELGMHGEEPEVGRLRRERAVEADQISGIALHASDGGSPSCRP